MQSGTVAKTENDSEAYFNYKLSDDTISLFKRCIWSTIKYL